MCRIPITPHTLGSVLGCIADVAAGQAALAAATPALEPAVAAFLSVDVSEAQGEAALTCLPDLDAFPDFHGCLPLAAWPFLRGGLRVCGDARAALIGLLRLLPLLPLITAVPGTCRAP